MESKGHSIWTKAVTGRGEHPKLCAYIIVANHLSLSLRGAGAGGGLRSTVSATDLQKAGDVLVILFCTGWGGRQKCSQPGQQNCVCVWSFGFIFFLFLLKGNRYFY